MSALSVALTALQAHQQSMLVTSQNIANANTAGYSVQRAGLTSVVLRGAGGTLSGGVAAGDIVSARDSQLDARVNDATSLKSGLEATASILADLESLFGAVDGTNLQSQLESVASAFNDLAANPDDDAVASAAVAALQALTAMISQTADGIDSAAAAVVADAAAAVDDVNEALGELSALNITIMRSGTAGGTSGEYADKQAAILERLAGYMRIQVGREDNGAVSVSCDGNLLVAGSSWRAMAVEASGEGSFDLVLAGSGIGVDAGSGVLAAYQDAVDTRLPAYAGQLDDVAIALISFLGSQQSIGSDGGDGSSEMAASATLSADQLTQDLDDIAFDPVHGLGFPAALAPEFPDTGAMTAMCINAYDAGTGVAEKYILRYDAGGGPVAASRSLQDIVDAINSGSGGGFTLFPAAGGVLTASLQPASGGYRLVIASTDGSTIDCGTAMDVRPSDGASTSEWAAGNAGFSVDGAYGGGAAYDPAAAMTIEVTDPGTIGDDADPPVVQLSIPVDRDGVVTLASIELTLDSRYRAGVPIDLGYGMSITFDAGTLATASGPLAISTDASDDRTGILGALGIDRLLVGTGAHDIQVADAIAADPSRIATGSSRASGAGDIADAMAELLDSAETASGSAVGTVYQSMISGLGLEVSNAQSMGDVQSLVLTTLENQRDLLIGVDVDEQMTLLIEQQQAYSAAAKVITMVRENLTTLMSIID